LIFPEWIVYSELLAPIHAFLACPTPDAWIDEAVRQQDTLLIDHANCEKMINKIVINNNLFILSNVLMEPFKQ
jgi:tRNA isopentenyl-2-thiomethyl-A-37 hydroxylase MiaE